MTDQNKKTFPPSSVMAELLGQTGSCPKDHSNEVENGSLWDCDHPECVALQHAAR